MLNIPEYITSLAISPCGNNILVGNNKGRCYVYDMTKDKIKFSHSFDFRNKMGKYSEGRNITGIEFLRRGEMLISTNDCRIRIANIDGRVMFKFKGHVNEEGLLKANYEYILLIISDVQNMIISPSSDNRIFIWNKPNFKMNSNEIIRSDDYNCFHPYDGSKEMVTACTFASDIIYAEYLKKALIILDEHLFVKSIIIALSSAGNISVFAEIRKRN